VLVDLKNGAYTDEQITAFVNNIHNKLPASDKLIADKIRNGEDYDLGQASSEDSYNKLRALVIYKFCTS
jgi:hypothetical protein